MAGLKDVLSGGLRKMIGAADIVSPTAKPKGKLKERGWSEDVNDSAMVSPSGKKFNYGGRGGDNPPKSYYESVKNAENYSDKTADNVHKAQKPFHGGMKTHNKPGDAVNE